MGTHEFYLGHRITSDSLSCSPDLKSVNGLRRQRSNALWSHLKVSVSLDGCSKPVSSLAGYWHVQLLCVKIIGCFFIVQARRFSGSTSGGEDANWGAEDAGEGSSTVTPGVRKQSLRNITPRSYSSLLKSESEGEEEEEDKEEDKTDKSPAKSDVAATSTQGNSSSVVLCGQILIHMKVILSLEHIDWWHQIWVSTSRACFLRSQQFPVCFNCPHETWFMLSSTTLL